MKTKRKSVEDYLSRIQAHTLKKYPGLQMRIVKRSDREAVIYFSTDDEDQEYPIIKRAGNLRTDALVENGYRIYMLPSPVPSPV